MIEDAGEAAAVWSVVFALVAAALAAALWGEAFAYLAVGLFAAGYVGWWWRA